MRLWLLMLLGVLLVSMSMGAPDKKDDKKDDGKDDDGSGSGDSSSSSSSSESDEDSGASTFYLTTTPAILASTVLALRVVG